MYYWICLFVYTKQNKRISRATLKKTPKGHFWDSRIYCTSHCLNIETDQQTFQGRDFKLVLKQIIPSTRHECVGDIANFFFYQNKNTTLVKIKKKVDCVAIKLRFFFRKPALKQGKERQSLSTSCLPYYYNLK